MLCVVLLRVVLKLQRLCCTLRCVLVMRTKLVPVVNDIDIKYTNDDHYEKLFI